MYINIHIPNNFATINLDFKMKPSSKQYNTCINYLKINFLRVAHVSPAPRGIRGCSCTHFGSAHERAVHLFDRLHQGLQLLVVVAADIFDKIRSPSCRHAD